MNGKRSVTTGMFALLKKKKKIQSRFVDVPFQSHETLGVASSAEPFVIRFPP